MNSHKTYLGLPGPPGCDAEYPLVFRMSGCDEPELISSQTEEFGCDQELQCGCAPILRFHTGKRALRQLEPFGIRDAHQAPDSVRQTRRVTDQQHML